MKVLIVLLMLALSGCATAYRERFLVCLGWCTLRGVHAVSESEPILPVENPTKCEAGQ